MMLKILYMKSHALDQGKVILYTVSLQFRFTKLVLEKDFCQNELSPV